MKDGHIFIDEELKMIPGQTYLEMIYPYKTVYIILMVIAAKSLIRI